MIYFLTGENSFEVQEAVQATIAAWVKAHPSTLSGPEYKEGSDLALRDLPDLLTAATLFSDERFIVIKNLSENTAAWQALTGLLPRLSADITLVIVEAKPDKRTTQFKALKAVSNYQEFPAWTERDTVKAEAWVSEEATKQSVSLSKPLIRLLVARVGVDQWQLRFALEKISLVAGEEAVTESQLVALIESSPTENVFGLFETALRGDSQQLHQMLATLELVEDPYRVFGLLSSQVFQLAAVSNADQGDNPASEFGIHPFVASKLSASAKRLRKQDVVKMVNAFAQADADLKSSRGEPWLLIERALLTIAA